MNRLSYFWSSPSAWSKRESPIWRQVRLPACCTASRASRTTSTWSSTCLHRSFKRYPTPFPWRSSTVRPTKCYRSNVGVRKLEYFREGHSEKHLIDIRGMLEVSGDLIDLPAITAWATKLGLQREWASATGSFRSSEAG